MEMVPEAKISFTCYCLGYSVLFPLLFLSVYDLIYWLHYLLASLLMQVPIILILTDHSDPASNRGSLRSVASRALLLGIGSATGIILTFFHSNISLFGIYMIFLCFFHWSEYFATAVTNADTLSLTSFLLNHSRHYHMAAVASWIEFFAGMWIYPSLKSHWYVSLLGLLLIVLGEILRKVAMFQAASNFNHYVQSYKRPGHNLVTEGVYSIARHPAYVGWFWWSIGTQLLLCNPICTIGYTIAAWLFFQERIEDEEINLLQFFGKDYEEYKKKVGTGLPFIYGCAMKP